MRWVELQLRTRKNSSGSLEFLRRLSLLINAGISLSKALDSVCDMDTTKEILDKVNSGSSFSASLAVHYSPAICNIISVGEKTGDLAGSLNKACRYLEKRSAIGKKIISSLTYPIFVLILCIGSMTILISVLLPSFAGIYSSMGVAMPLISRVILAIGGYLPLIFIVMIFMSYLSYKYAASDKGLKLPSIGPFRKLYMSTAFYDAMAQYLEAGLSVVSSLELSMNINESCLYRSCISKVCSSVQEGIPLSHALFDTGLFRKTDISLIGAGENSSSLPLVFKQLSVYYEEEIENNIKTFTSLVEPISTLSTGLVVGIIVFAMFMPIIKLISVLGS